MTPVKPVSSARRAYIQMYKMTAGPSSKEVSSDPEGGGARSERAHAAATSM